MKTLHISIAVLTAGLVVSAIFVATALAETTLLAEWLANGSGLVTNTSVEISTTLKLEDTETIAGKGAVKCGMILDGTVGADGSGEITKILNIEGDEVGGLGGFALIGAGAGSDCQALSACSEGSVSSPIEVNPGGYPWKLELFLMENGEFLVLVVKFGYELLCLVLGLNAEDACTIPDFELPANNDATSGDAVLPAKATSAPKLTCSQSSGKSSGVVEVIPTSSIKLVNGGLLTLSSE